jgi:hypothetical protein
MLADFYITDDSNDAVLTKAMFKSSQLCKNFDAARYWCHVWVQLLYSNHKNRLCWVVLGLSQDGACTDFYENLGGSAQAWEFSARVFALSKRKLIWASDLGIAKKSNFSLGPWFRWFLVFLPHAESCALNKKKMFCYAKIKILWWLLWDHKYTYNVFLEKFPSFCSSL